MTAPAPSGPPTALPTALPAGARRGAPPPPTWSARFLRPLLALLALLAGVGTGWAQPLVSVNGSPVTGATTTLVAGATYAPASELAAALGAELLPPAGGRLTLRLGGRLLQLELVDEAADAHRAGALQRDGVALGDLAAVRVPPEVFVPVAPLARALGGSVAFLPERNAVTVVTPRARVSDARLERGADGEALRLRVSAAVPVSRLTAVGDTLLLRLDRASLTRAVNLEGDLLQRADVLPAGDHVDVRLQLAPGASARAYELPLSAPGRLGFELVVRVTASEAGAEVAPDPTDGTRAPTEPAPRVVLDAGHGGADSGLDFGAAGTEATLARSFGAALAAALERRGVEVRAAAPSGASTPALRSEEGIGADLLVSLHAADLPPGSFRVYYLGDAASRADLEYAIRHNAAPALRELDAAGENTDAVRRRVLLSLVPDLALGRRYAEQLEAELQRRAGYRAEFLRAAPLAVLTGAAGRGLLLEFSPEDLASARLPDALAAAIEQLLADATPAP